MKEDDRCSRRIGAHEHRGASDTMRWIPTEVREQEIEWEAGLAHDPGENLSSGLPCRHERKDGDRDDERHPAAVGDLERIRAEEGEIDREEERGQCDDTPQGPV